VTTASAAGKIILLGEHAVVHGRPAIAVPLSALRATAEVAAIEPGRGVLIEALDLGESCFLDRAYASDTAQALQTTVRNTLGALGLPCQEQSLRIAVRSQVPIARGLGSGTAVSVAIVRALAAHFGRDLGTQDVSELAYRTEIILHGTPSGMDNTVVAYEQPVYFLKGQPAEPLQVGAPLALVIADTGHPSRTRDTVAAVRRRWQADPARHERLFDEIGALVQDGREALLVGDLLRLGRLMDRDHGLLCALQVSSPELDRLVGAARDAGALGAKLSGGGGGGCMVALAAEGRREGIAAALWAAGAGQVLSSALC